MQRKGSEAYHGGPQPGVEVRVRGTQMVFPDCESPQEWLGVSGFILKRHALFYHVLQYLMTERELGHSERWVPSVSQSYHGVAATGLLNR